MDINDILKGLEVQRIWEDEFSTYVKEILDEIENFLKEETEKQDFIEANLRSDKESDE